MWEKIKKESSRSSSSPFKKPSDSSVSQLSQNGNNENGRASQKVDSEGVTPITAEELEDKLNSAGIVLTSKDNNKNNVRISAAYDTNGGAVYNIGQMRERAFPNFYGSSDNNAGAQQGNALSEKSVSQLSQNGNTQNGASSRKVESDEYIFNIELTENKNKAASPPVRLISENEVPGVPTAYDGIVSQPTEESKSKSSRKVDSDTIAPMTAEEAAEAEKDARRVLAAENRRLRQRVEYWKG